MPIPDNPQTRQEMYLNAMATGDSSGIPESPQTREEMYLDAIVKNGSGGSGGGSGGGGGSSTLSGLTDVDISNPTNGQTLVYNATSGKWENGASGGGGGGGGSTTKSLETIDDTKTATQDPHGEYEVELVSTLTADEYPGGVACRNVIVTVGDIITTIPYVGTSSDWPVDTPSNIEEGSISLEYNQDGLWALIFRGYGEPVGTGTTVSAVGELYTLSDELRACLD